MKTHPPKNDAATSPETSQLREQLSSLYLSYVAQHFEALGQQAALAQSGHVEYLAQLINGEVQCRLERSLLRRVQAARLPVIKTLEQFNWSWPKKIN